MKKIILALLKWDILTVHGFLYHLRLNYNSELPVQSPTIIIPFPTVPAAQAVTDSLDRGFSQK